MHLGARRTWLLVSLLAAILLATAAALFINGTIRFNTPDPDRYPVRGIDVSHHQGPIDWPRVAAAGYAFAFIKASEGGDFRDRRFEENWRAAGEAGLARGAYHFFTLCRPGLEQADNFIEAVAEGAELPPAVDLEFGGNCSARPTSDEVHAELRAFLTRVADHSGRTPILYVTSEFLDDYLAGAHLDSPIWIRDIFWQPSLPDGRDWLFWQHHNRGRVDGVEGPVDLDVFAAGAEAFEALSNER